jgi:hypothetical protein
MSFRCFFGVLLIPVLANGAGFQLEAPDGSCHLSVSADHPVGTFFISADAVGHCGCVDGAEFRVAGLSSDWFVTATPNPSAVLALGSPLGGGAIIVFPTCSPQVTLYTVAISYSPGGIPPPTTLHVEAPSTNELGARLRWDEKRLADFKQALRTRVEDSGGAPGRQGDDRLWSAPNSALHAPVAGVGRR